MSDERETAFEQLAAQLLAAPPVSRALDALVVRPRLLQVAATGMCALTVWAAVGAKAQPQSRPQEVGAWTPNAAQATNASFAIATPGEAEDARAAVEVVAAYNQASAEAARAGRVELLAAHTDQSGPAWVRVQAEYERRARADERRDAILRRWSVLAATQNGERARVETQELWDVVVMVEGQVAASRRGVLTRNVYELRRAPTGWLVMDVATETIVQ